MKVSLIAGCLLDRDAISGSTRMKARALREICASLGIVLDLRIFVTQADKTDDGDVVVIGGVGQLVFDPHFLSSSLIIYEFGIFYQLFDSIHLAPPAAQVFVHFHNITPMELVPPVSREFIFKSYDQMVHMMAADVIINESVFNRGDLLAYGVPEEKIEYVNLVVEAGAATTDSQVPAREADGPVRALYVGRFVPSKGVLDLLKALRLAVAGGADIRLDLVGNQLLSDRDYLNSLRAFVSEYRLADRVAFLGEVSDAELKERYRRSHLLLMASYHEGFCLPVVEALSNGCFVIAYNTGNLPYTVNGLGNVVAAGDVQALAAKLVVFARAREQSAAGGEMMLPADVAGMAETEFNRRAREYCADFSYERFRERFRGILARHLLDDTATGSSPNDQQSH